MCRLNTYEQMSFVSNGGKFKLYTALVYFFQRLLSPTFIISTLDMQINIYHLSESGVLLLPCGSPDKWIVCVSGMFSQRDIQCFMK
jgi:hypothetical protein